MFLMIMVCAGPPTTDSDGGGGSGGGGGGDEDDDKDNGGRIGHTRVLHLSQTAQSPPQNDPDKILTLAKVEFKYETYFDL